ncbi:MAG: PHP domain-containing protein [bacterium]
MLPKKFQFRFGEYFERSGEKVKLKRTLSIEGHAHTDFTDGRSSAEDCAARAVEAGLETLVFAEHIHRGAPWFEPYAAEIERLKALHKGKLKIVCGIEARIIDAGGELDADEEMLERAEVVVGSVHALPPAGKSPVDLLYIRSRREKLDCELELLEAIAKNPAVDVVGHPFGSYFEPHGPPPEDYMFKVLDFAAAPGKAVEINAAHADVGWFLNCAMKYGKDFLFWPASDAHYARDVGRICGELNKELKD